MFKNNLFLLFRVPHTFEKTLQFDDVKCKCSLFLLRLLQCNQFIRCQFQVRENQIFYAKQFFRFITSKCSIVMCDLWAKSISFRLRYYLFAICAAHCSWHLSTHAIGLACSQNSASAAWKQHSNRIDWDDFSLLFYLQIAYHQLLNQITIIELTRRYNGNTIMPAWQFIHIPYSKLYSTDLRESLQWILRTRPKSLY